MIFLALISPVLSPGFKAVNKAELWKAIFSLKLGSTPKHFLTKYLSARDNLNANVYPS